jgi:lipopolysaccharide/colanic/teichoic acid biosynthesis glycosyltransferase
MIKRLFDIMLSAFGLLLLSPLILGAAVLIWAQDRHSPFYIAPRIGRGEQPFRMVKLRSMIIAADRNGVNSTAATDPRITPIGHFVRRWKLDELTQLWNVLLGDMSLVGPRPNTAADVALYSPEHRELLSVRPGITDFSSIVFSDEGEILRGAKDPDRLYLDIIWPWKSALGLLYVRNSTILLDLRLVMITVVAIVDREAALRRLQPILAKVGAPPSVLQAAARQTDLRVLASSVG